MSDEAKKQLIRYLLEEAFAGNFTPLERHRGLHESIPMLRHLNENTSDRALSFPFQFVANDWIVTVARRSYTSISPIFGFDAGQQQVTYDVLHFHHFDQEEIILEHLQALEMLRADRKSALETLSNIGTDDGVEHGLTN